MRSALISLLLLGMVGAAHAAPLKVVLFAPGTSDTAARDAIAAAPYDSFPSCTEGSFPCATQATKKKKRVWKGSGSIDGQTCDTPTAYPIFEDLKPETFYTYGMRVTRNCSLKLSWSRIRRPSFGGIRPLATLSFGDMAMGVYFQPNVARGQKIKRVIFARWAMRKNGSNWTRNPVGMYFTEQWGFATGSTSPVCGLDSWIVAPSTSGASGNPWRNYTHYRYTPQAVASPFQLGAEVVASFINGTGKTHWSDVLCAVGANQQKTFRCTHGGTLAIGSTILCEIYFNKITDPQPL